MTARNGSAATASQAFLPWRVVAVVAVAMVALNLSIRSYSRAVALPRYCDDIEQALGRLERILTQSRPAPDGERRDYLIAAKLLFLVPQRAEEPVEAYLARVRFRLHDRCR